MRRRMTCALGALALGFLTGEAEAQQFTPVSRTTAVPTTVINIDNNAGSGAAPVRPTSTTTIAPKTTVIDIDNFNKNFGDLQPRPIITNTTPKTTVIGTDSNDTGINIPKVRSITTETPKTTVIGIEGNEPAISMPQVRSITTSTPKTLVNTGDGKAPKIETLTAPMLVQEPGNGFFGSSDNHHGQNCKWHWEVGGGVYYVQPFFHTNPAFLRTTGGILAPVTQQSDFRYNMQVAPLGWIAYVSDSGAGIRGRYFQFDQGARENFTGNGTSVIRSVPTNGGPFSVAGGAPGDVLNFNSRLRVEVWDLEGTYTFSSCRWTFLAAAGVRYANMFQSYGATVTPGSAGTLPSSASTVSSFNGAGPTFALESKYRFGESGLSVYGTARGSVLFGPGRLTSGSTANLGDNIVVASGFESHQSDILPIGEAEVGIEFGRSVGKVRVFAQTGFVGQVWFGGGNAASTGVGGHSFSNDTNFGFVGVAGRLGINF